MSTMVRLNACIRDATITNLINKKFVTDNLLAQKRDEAEKEARKASEKLAYEAAFTKETRKILNDAAPGMFPQSMQVSIRIENSPGNYYDRTFTFGELKPVPYRNSQYGGGGFAAVIDASHPLAVAAKKWEDAKTEKAKADQELREKKGAAVRKLETIINSVTTVKRLLEVWPEVKDFLPEVVTGTDGGVPAVLIEDINKEFGIG